MTAVTACVDQDRNLRFDHPSDWTVSIEQIGPGLPDALVVSSRTGPDGSGVLVVVNLDWHELVGLGAFVDRRLDFLARSFGYVVGRRSAGRHPASGLAAASVACDSTDHGVAQRHEMIFMEPSPGLVLSATASCRATSRHLWRDGYKLILSTLNVLDRDRPPVAASGGLVGVGLRGRPSEQMRRLWMLFDLTGRNLVTVVGPLLEEHARIQLGAAASFETRAYLLHEMCLTMLGYRYPANCYRRVREAFVQAITGKGGTNQAGPAGASARLDERAKVYTAAGGKQIARERIVAFADLLVSSGTSNSPLPINAADFVGSASKDSLPRRIVLDTHLDLTMGYRMALCHLFRDTPDIERLSVEEIDARFDAGIADASGTVSG